MRQFLRYALFLTVATANISNARDLAQILRAGVVNNPQILEAQANQAVAEATLNQTRAARYPTLQATATQPLLNSASSSRKWSPGLKANWTLYDFGQTNAKVKRDEVQTQYYGHKLNETSSEWAYSMAGYYLEALKAKLQLKAAQENLALHQHIVEQLMIINQYDPGRRSELTQAESRLARVQDSIVTYERSLGLALRKMARYVHPAVGESELSDPFLTLSVHDLMNKYPLDEERLYKNESYLAQERELKRAEANLKIAERSRYPSIGVEATASREQSALYLTMTTDIFNKTKAPAIDEQRYTIKAAQAKMNQIIDNLSQQAELAIIEMQQNQNQLKILKNQIFALKQVVVDYEDQFKIGTRTLLNVVDAYSELSSAEQGKVTAEYNLMMAKLEYLSAVGAIAKWADLPQLYDPQKGAMASEDIDKSIENKNTEIHGFNEPVALVDDNKKIKKQVTMNTSKDSVRAQQVPEFSLPAPEPTEELQMRQASISYQSMAQSDNTKKLQIFNSQLPDLTTDYVYIPKSSNDFIPVTESSDLVLKKSSVHVDSNHYKE